MLLLLLLYTYTHNETPGRFGHALRICDDRSVLMLLAESASDWIHRVGVAMIEAGHDGRVIRCGLTVRPSVDDHPDVGRSRAATGTATDRPVRSRPRRPAFPSSSSVHPV